MAVDGVNKNTTDWAHEYSFWAAAAVLERAKVTGDFAFATKLLPQLIKFYDTRSPQYNPQLGLYWQTPVWDAMEFSASSYQSPDPYHGGDGYRPTINAYQFGDAEAISVLAALNGNLSTSSLFATSYTSPNPQDWWSVDFGQLRQVSDVRIYLYNDNGGVKTPVSYQLQYLA